MDRRQQVRRIRGPELPRPILAPPFEQQVRVDAVLQRQLRYRGPPLARCRRKPTLELHRVIRTTLPARPAHPCCRQSSPHHLFGGHYSGYSHAPRECGLRMTLTGNARNGTVMRRSGSDRKHPDPTGRRTQDLTRKLLFFFSLHARNVPRRGTSPPCAKMAATCDFRVIASLITAAFGGSEGPQPDPEARTY